jgi:perosamine synthetase
MIPLIEEEEAQAVSEYMKSGGFLTEYTKTTELEKAIAEFVGARNVIMVSNGSVSLYMILKVLGIGQGDDVLVPNYTMIATANAVVLTGANPLFVDVEPETLCIDFLLIDSVITNRTKAIILVTANGRYPSYPMDALLKYCDGKGIYLIEDAAQSLGSQFPSGAHQGTVGIMGSFSFSVPKVITTGQGGCIVTNNDELAQKVRKLKDFGRVKGGIDIHSEIGFNFKYTDLQAVIGIEQMKKLPNRVNKKREIWNRYHNNLMDCHQVEFFKFDHKFTTPWFIDVLVERREELQSHLYHNGISTRVMYPPITRQGAYDRKGEYPVAEKVGLFGLWLPSYVQLENEDIDFICSVIQEFFIES